MSAKATKKKSTVTKAAKLRDSSHSDLDIALGKAKAELLDLRIRQSSGQVDNPIRLRILRRDIARTTTILAEKARAPKAA
ncbi:MAG: 50S ribosomal protein L29 [Puniceicoccales bacterium]|jgi:large subunit ribosomal protein L29|nr:50S ribosomal protein L29 [Puniceicoccales bacterium]